MFGSSRPLSPPNSKSRVSELRSSFLSPTGDEAKQKENRASSSLSLKQGLQEYYGKKDKLPATADGRELPIVEVQLSLVESAKEKNKRLEIKNDTKEEKEASAKKEAPSDKKTDKRAVPPLQERGENDSLKYYEDWHNTKDETISIDKMFGEGKQKSRRVLVLGPMGIGKTTLSQRIAYLWSQKSLWKETEYVFWLPLRHLTQERYKDKDVTLAQVLHESCLTPEAQKRIPLASIQRALTETPSKVLMVLDGFDEIAAHLTHKDKPTHTGNLFNEACGVGQVILTSRPYQLTPELLQQFERQLENRGFNSEQIETYVDHYFRTLNPPNVEWGEQLIQWLKNNPRLSGMSHVPINLNLLCAVWHDHKKDHSEGDETFADIFSAEMNLTSLYREMVDHLLKRYLKEKRGVDTRNKSASWVHQQCRREVHFLEYLAYRGMREKQIQLSGPWVKSVIHDWEKTYGQENFSFEEVLSLGFLSTLESNTSAEVGKDDIDKTHYFLHLSFQEYFAGCHLLESLKIGNGYQPHWEASHFIADEKYNPRFAMVFVFAAGLTHLEKSAVLTQELWRLLLSSPIDLTGLGYLRLTLRCLSEAEFDPDIPYLYEVEQQLQHAFTTTIQHCLDTLERSPGGELVTLTRDWVPFLSPKASKIMEVGVAKLFGIIQNTDDHEKHSEKIHRALSLLSEIAHCVVATDSILELLVKIIFLEKTKFTFNKRMYRSDAIEILGRLAYAQDKIINLFLKKLNSDDSSIVHFAALGFEALGRNAAREDVMTAFMNILESEGTITNGVVRAIGSFGEKAARENIIQALIKLLNYKNIADEVAKAIEKIGKKAIRDDVIAALIKSLENGNDVAAEVLGNFYEKTLREDIFVALIKALEGEDQYKVSQAAKAFEQLGEKAAREDVIAALLKAMKNAGSETQCIIIKILGKIAKSFDQSKVIPVLINALLTPDHKVVSAALQALHELDETQIRREVLSTQLVGTLMANLAHSAHWHALAEVFVWLSEKILPYDVLDALLGVIKNAGEDSDTGVKHHAIYTLGQLSKQVVARREEEVIHILLKALSDTNSRVREAAAEALGNLGEKAQQKEVTSALSVAVHDKDWSMKFAATFALWRLQGKVDPTSVHEVGAEMIGVLAQAVDHSDSLWFKGTSAYFLWKIVVKADKSITQETLITVLTKALKDPDPNVSHAASETVRTMSLSKVLEAHKSKSPHLWSDWPMSIAFLAIFQGIPVVAREKNGDFTGVVFYSPKSIDRVDAPSSAWVKSIVDAAHKQAQKMGFPCTSCVSRKETQSLTHYLQSPAASLKPAPVPVFPELLPKVERLGTVLTHAINHHVDDRVNKKVDEKMEEVEHRIGMLEHDVADLKKVTEELAKEQKKLADEVMSVFGEKMQTLKSHKTSPPRIAFPTQPRVQQFYAKFKNLLEEFYTAACLIAEEKVSPSTGKAGTAVAIVKYAGKFIPFPYASLAVDLLCAGADAKLRQDKMKEAKEGSHFLTSALSEQAACILATRYQRQIEELTEKGVSELAACARQRVVEHMVSLNTSHPENHLHTDAQKVRILVDGVVQGNPSFSVVNTKVEVADKKKHPEWRAEGLFKRAGLELSNGACYIVEAQENESSSLVTNLIDDSHDPRHGQPKYGYRYGEQYERVLYGFNKQTKPATKPSSPEPKEEKDVFPEFNAQLFYEYFRELLEAHRLKSQWLVEGKLKPDSPLKELSINLLQTLKPFEFLAGKASDEIQSHFGVDTHAVLKEDAAHLEEKAATTIASKLDASEIAKAKQVLEVLKEKELPEKIALTLTKKYAARFNELTSKNIKALATHLYEVVVQIIADKQPLDFSQKSPNERAHLLCEKVLAHPSLLKKEMKLANGKKQTFAEFLKEENATSPHGKNRHLAMPAPSPPKRSSQTSEVASVNTLSASAAV